MGESTPSGLAMRIPALLSVSLCLLPLALCDGHHHHHHHHRLPSPLGHRPLHRAHIGRTSHQGPRLKRLPSVRAKPLKTLISRNGGGRRSHKVNTRHQRPRVPVGGVRPITQTHTKPLPRIAYLQANQIPGYQTFQLHHAIRKQEGLEIFENGRKPDVIHIVDPPTILSTEDFSDRIDERTARVSIAASSDGVVVGKGLTKEPEGVVSRIEIYELSR